jgi:hypothetical protein
VAVRLAVVAVDLPLGVVEFVVNLLVGPLRVTPGLVVRVEELAGVVAAQGKTPPEFYRKVVQLVGAVVPLDGVPDVGVVEVVVGGLEGPGVVVEAGALPAPPFGSAAAFVGLNRGRCRRRVLRVQERQQRVDVDPLEFRRGHGDAPSAGGLICL